MKKILILSITLMAFACANKSTVPDNVIPQKTFTDIMVDIRRLEGAYSIKHLEVDTSDIKIYSYYQKVFSLHNVSQENFVNSYQYYAQHPEMMMVIEDSALQILSKQQAQEESIGAPK